LADTQGAGSALCTFGACISGHSPLILAV
jgi:hypothetical protein